MPKEGPQERQNISAGYLGDGAGEDFIQYLRIKMSLTKLRAKDPKLIDFLTASGFAISCSWCLIENRNGEKNSPNYE